jgi:hypothetical protein
MFKNMNRQSMLVNKIRHLKFNKLNQVHMKRPPITQCSTKPLMGCIYTLTNL